MTPNITQKPYNFVTITTPVDVPPEMTFKKQGQIKLTLVVDKYLDSSGKVLYSYRDFASEVILV